MKKSIVIVSVLFIVLGLIGCRSGPHASAPPSATPEIYKTVFIDLVYDPILLITHDEKVRVVEELQSQLKGLGFAIATSEDRADMILAVTINDLDLTHRSKRLMARTTFGLVKDAAVMDYTASFVDSKTLDEITSKKGELKTTKYFPSQEEIKTILFSEMEDEIVKFVSESKAF